MYIYKARKHDMAKSLKKEKENSWSTLCIFCFTNVTIFTFDQILNR